LRADRQADKKHLVAFKAHIIPLKLFYFSIKRVAFQHALKASKRQILLCAGMLKQSHFPILAS